MLDFLFRSRRQEPWEEAEEEVLNYDKGKYWQDSKSRSSVEMNDRSSRPAIGSTVDDMSRYDVVFVGFPVWWYREPSIIDTFMEQYDFSGKTVIPFATSGMSGIGDSGSNMQALAPGAKVEKGKRFPAGTSAKELADWASKWL